MKNFFDDDDNNKPLGLDESLLDKLEKISKKFSTLDDDLFGNNNDNDYFQFHKNKDLIDNFDRTPKIDTLGDFDKYPKKEITGSLNKQNFGALPFDDDKSNEPDYLGLKKDKNDLVGNLSGLGNLDSTKDNDFKFEPPTLPEPSIKPDEEVFNPRFGAPNSPNRLGNLDYFKGPEMIPERYIPDVGPKEIYQPEPFRPMSNETKTALHNTNATVQFPGGNVAPANCDFDGTHGNPSFPDLDPLASPFDPFKK